MTKGELKKIKELVDAGYSGLTGAKNNDLIHLLVFAEHIVNTIELEWRKPCGVQDIDNSEDVSEDLKSVMDLYAPGEPVRIQEFYAGPIRTYTLVPVDAEGNPCPQCEGKGCTAASGEDCPGVGHEPVRVS